MPHLSKAALPLFFFLTCFLQYCVGEDTGQKKRNVLFIAVDDLRPELNCYGSAPIHSPSIDRLATSGLLFERAYCQQTVCNPSRTSLMTGMRPDSIGVVGNHIHFRTNNPDVLTLPQHFMRHGYHAQAIGKIYHGVFPGGSSITKWDTMGDPQSWSVPAIRFGPRYYYTEEGIADAKRMFEKIYKPQNPGPDDWTKKLVFGPATESPDVADNVLYDGKVADAAVKALNELSKKPDSPFFLAVGFIKPHSPYIAPRKYFDLYDDIELAKQNRLPADAPSFAGHGSGELRRYTDQPSNGPIPENKQRRVRHAYYACVSYIDHQIGKVLNELERLGLSDNTVVCLYGDHGYHLGELGLWGKTTNFELDTRVPLIVRVPGMKTAGQSTKSLVELVDLYPTLAELCELPIAEHVEGRSFAKLLDDPTVATKQFALSQYPRGRDLMGYSMRTRKHRLTLWMDRITKKIRATELYDYSDGLIESRNIAGEPKNGKLVGQLSKQLIGEFGLDSNEGDNKSITGKKGPRVETERKKFDEGSLTSFESEKPGAFQKVKTVIGTWQAESGNAEINKSHAKSGKQCLHILGGDSKRVELSLDNSVDASGQLSFWAERWTSRDPFLFRIEKYSDKKWTVIFNGDKQVRVGRSFLSHVTVPLGDKNIERLRFTCTSPQYSGILIDDIAIKPAMPQSIKSVEVVTMTLPALVNTPASALLKLRISTEGSLNPISVREITACLEGTTNRRDIQSVQVLYTDNESEFRNNSERFGGTQRPTESQVFRGTQQLAEGDNYFWIACTLSKESDIDGNVGASIQKISFSNDSSRKLNSEPSLQRMGIALRNGGDDNVHTYRIPGLATTVKGTLIGVYDVRRRGGGDLPGDIDVGMSRSIDGGRTWEPMKIIMDMGNGPKFNFDGIGDPTVLVDKNTNTIWVAATWSHGNRSWTGSGPGLDPDQTGQFMLVRSDDDGRTWSKPINITKQVKNPDWCFLLQGPGKGITMADGTIVFPVQYQDPPNKTDKQAHRLPHSTFIFSSDHGKTWKIASGAHDDTTESQIVELSDGRLMLNCRFNRESKRVVMVTDDMGKTWGEHSTNRKSLVEPRSCMASLINVGRELGTSEDQLLLFSNPNSLTGRNHMTIKASTDHGESWPLKHQLLLDEQSGRGYSCMSMIDEKTVGILYEGSLAHLTFQRIPLADIIDSNPTQAESKQLSISRVFGDHMVLQADKPIRVWGRGKPEAVVTVSLGDQVTTGSVDGSGNWKVDLPPRRRNSIPTVLTATIGDESVAIKDILIGEVWFCAGQSNMEWPLSKSANAKSALLKSTDAHLRLFNFAGAARGSSGVYGQALLNRLDPKLFSDGHWQVASPGSARNFSAVSYFFARQLRKELDCAIGVINVAIGGTPVESWISESTLSAQPELSRMVDGNWLDNPVLDQWCKDRARSNLSRGLSGELEMMADAHGPHHSFKPGFMYESAVKPFVPMSIKGVLWYQGESNAENEHRVNQYRLAFPQLVSNWRTAFQSDKLPFVFVQLPAMGRSHWPLFREVQRRSLAEIPNTGMAITIDVGDPKNVHPISKRPVGNRLARWALANVYNLDVVPSGPLFKSVEIVGSSIVVNFKSTGSGLKTNDSKAPRHFEVAGNDGKFQTAKAKINGSRIILSTPFVNKPVHARYAWKAFPEPPVNLVNSADLPVSPFTTLENFLANLESR